MNYVTIKKKSQCHIDSEVIYECVHLVTSLNRYQTSLLFQTVKNQPDNSGDWGLILWSGRSPGEGNGNPLSILAWRIPWTEELGGLQSKGSQRVRHD